MSTVPVDDLGEEREVDLRSLRERLVARWWIVLGGLILGAVVGVLVATGGGKVYDAKALLYLGQPFAGGAQVTTLATNPRTVSALIRNEATLAQVAEETGLPIARIRGVVTAQAITGIGTSAGLGRSAPLIELTAQMKSKANAEKVANAFAAIVTSSVGSYVDEKLKILADRVANDRALIETATQNIELAVAQQRQAQSSTSLSLSDRILVQSNANTSLQFWQARANDARADLNEARQLQSLAENVERSRVVQPAVGAPTSARNRRNSLVVGALIGLILGGVVGAALPDRRTRKTPAPK